MTYIHFNQSGKPVIVDISYSVFSFLIETILNYKDINYNSFSM